MLKIRLFIAVLAMTTGAVFAAPTKTEVVTTSQITNIPNGTVDSKFTELSPVARSRGLDQVIIQGAFKSTLNPDTTRKYSIEWNVLQLVRKGRVFSTPISKPLFSKFSGPEEIDVDTKMTMVGPFSVIASAFSDLLSKAEADEEEVLTSLALFDNSTASQGSDQTPSMGNNGAGGKPEPGDGKFDLTDMYSSDKSDTLVIPCEDRIDLKGRVVFAQSRIEEINEDGKVGDPGTCSDTGTEMPIYPDFGGVCGHEDGGDGWAYSSYIPVYNKKGIEIMVSTSCWKGNAIDTPDNRFKIEERFCSFFNDPVLKISTRMVKNVVVIDGVTYTISDCHMSDETAPYETENCGTEYDSVSERVFQKTIGFSTFDGIPNIFRHCSVARGESHLVLTACDIPNRYDTSSSSEFAYLNQFLYNPNIEKAAGPCRANKETQYKILKDVSGCTPIYDDANQRITWMAKRHFVGLAGASVTIDDQCIDIGTEPYKDGKQEWIETKKEWIELDNRLLRDTHADQGLGLFYKEAWPSLDEEIGFRKHDYIVFPDGWTFEWVKQKGDENTVQRIDENIRIGCGFFRDGNLLSDNEVRKLHPKLSDRKIRELANNNRVRGSRWECNIQEEAVGYANLADWSLMQVQDRGNGSVYKSCSVSQRYINAFGAVPPSNPVMTKDFGECL